jgi:N6-adenosine-specific RNA methylase IME4
MAKRTKKVAAKAKRVAKPRQRARAAEKRTPYPYGSRELRQPSVIKVGDRARKDLGDIGALVRSINDRGGLIQPIVISPDNELIAGARRLAAWQNLKCVFNRDPIPVVVFDPDDPRRAERDENCERKDFTPEEMVQMKRWLQPQLKAAARERQRAAPKKSRAGQQDNGSGAERLDKDASGGKDESRSSPGRGRAADQVAAFVGRDRRTIDKAEAVVDAAERNPEKFGKLRDDMNRTGRVDGPFRRLQVMEQAENIKKAPPGVPMRGPYGTVVIDFPWPHEPEMEQEELDARGRSLRPYAAMSIKAGAKFLAEQVKPILKDDCVVWFWTTNFHMPYAFHLLQALGFREHSTIGTWVKSRLGRGQVLREKTEHCIVAKRGKPVINLTNETTLWEGEGFESRENSRKPEAFYRLVECLTPAPRYASIFSTGAEGELWDSHGDQVGKHASAPEENRLAAAMKFSNLDASKFKGEPVIPDELPKALTAPALLALVECGEPVAAEQLDTLRRLKLIIGKKAPKLTKLGTEQLLAHRKETAHREALAALPGGIEELIADYGATLERYDVAVRVRDDMGKVLESDRLELLQEKANGGTSFGMATAESPAEQLRARNAAPIGCSPLMVLWGQRAIFRLDIDGTPYLLTTSAASDCDFCDVHAEDPDKPFISETGYCSLYTSSDNDVRCGETVVAYCERLIREQIASSIDHTGKRKPRKKPMPLPETWYRLPTSWDERPEGIHGPAEPVEVGSRGSRRQHSNKQVDLEDLIEAAE